MNSKLILLNGPCGAGKSTIAQLYINTYPLSLSINIDEIIAMLGQWEKDESKSRPLAISLALAMAMTHVKSGYDVIIPYVFTSTDTIEQFQNIAHDTKSLFLEYAIMIDKQDSVNRMIKRGTWGEPGSPPLTNTDIPIIENLYDEMMTTLSKRQETISIQSIENEVDKTFTRFIEDVLKKSKTI